jgi:hypothetical protein
MTRYSYSICDPTTAAHGTGTISVGAASKAVTGVTTSFTTQLVVGDVIISDGQTLAVAAIADNTHLTLQSNTVGAISGAAFDYATLVNLESLSTPVYPPKSTYRPYTEAVTLASGKLRGLGRPVALWQWGFITRAMRDKLRTYCTGKSAAVYIRTRTNESSDAYSTFSAVMMWPDDEDKQTGRRVNFAVDFKNIVTL